MWKGETPWDEEIAEAERDGHASKWILLLCAKRDVYRQAMNDPVVVALVDICRRAAKGPVWISDAITALCAYQKGVTE